MCSLSIVYSTNAQSCGNDGPGACTPLGGPASGGFGNLNDIPCIVKNSAYTGNLQFTMFSNFNFQGQQNIDSIEFISFNNLPCGICWSVNKASKRYKANEDGCIKFSGSTNDASGQYKLNASFKAWINGGPQPITVPASLADDAGVRIILRVKDDASANCPNVDTSSGAPNLTATTGCPVGIEDISNNITYLTVSPNPFTQNAVVSFSSTQNGNYTLRVIDLNGRTLQEKKLDVTVGTNQTEIQRGNLATGVYFISVHDGKNAISKRFTITD